MSKPKYRYMHGVHVKKDNGDAVVCTLKNVDTHETILQEIEDPKRSFFVAKPGIQNSHTEKKEWEYMNNLDKYIVNNHELNDQVKRQLGIKRWMHPSQLYKNPYLYGADIDIDVLIKQSHLRSTEKVPSKYNVGGLDIETSVHGGDEVQICSFIDHNLNVFCAYHTAWLKEGQTPETIDRHIDSALNKLVEEINNDGLEAYLRLLGKTTGDIDNVTKLKGLSDDQLKLFKEKVKQKLRPRVQFFPTNSEVDLIKWIFDRIHDTKPDFISIWNIDYDIPYLLKRLNFHGVNPIDVMCHPDVKRENRICDYKKDNSKLVEHQTFMWHWLSLSGYTQFYDSMCLYSRNRKVQGMETSYTLDYISGKLLGTAKLDFGAGHFVMQRDRYDEYIAYNVIDTILLVILEEVVNDIVALLELCEKTSIAHYSKQTTTLKNSYYYYCQDKKRVPASCVGDQALVHDAIIFNQGGGVLDPNRTDGIGVNKLEESDINTNLTMMTLDLDVTLRPLASA